MRIVRLFALLTLAASPGLMLVGCQPAASAAPKQPTLVSIAVAPVASGTTTVPVAGTQALRVTGSFSDASTLDLTCGSTFTSSDTTIATVSVAGVVTALKVGEATITARHTGGACAQTPSDKSATIKITVPRAALVSIALTPAIKALAQTATQALSVTATYADGSTETLTSGLTFASSDDAIATVSTAGVVTAQAPGTATITATQTSSGETATALIDVTLANTFQTITFDQSAITYTLIGFAGAEDSQVIADPAGGLNKVAQVVRTVAALSFAGTVVSTRPNDAAGKIPFDAANTRMTVRVRSPDAGIKVRLKVEDSTDSAISVETDATTTVAGAWETLTFDFANPATGSPLNFSSTYDKVIIFFNFGTTGAQAGSDKIYLFDDVTFTGGTGGVITGPFSTLTFDSPLLTYKFTGFAGAEDSSLQPDPTGAPNTVARVVRSAAALSFAGTVASTRPNDAAGKIPFDATHKKMNVRVYSPDAGVIVRLKVEDSTNSAISVETDATTTVAGAWETLTFDFATPATGPALDVNSTYDKVIIFFNFGTTGAQAGAKTYYFDDVAFGP